MTEITVKIDRAGRVSIPKQFRDELHLQEGDTLTITQQGNHLALRPHPDRPSLRKKGRFWVINTGQTISAETTNRIIEEIRNGGGRDI
jgi:AbrB family looped-hinge helix DNA binding protein